MTDNTQDDLVERVAAAKASNAALRKALKPFAECCDFIDPDEDGEEWAKFRLTIQQFRDARAAIDAMQPDLDATAIRNAALREAAEVCTRVIKDYDVMKPDGKTYASLPTQKAAKGMVSLAREDIKNLIDKEPKP